MKKKTGSPEIYGEEWANEAAKKIPGMMAKGESIAEVCAQLDISKPTFYKCRDRYSEFADAVKKGETLSEAWWAKLGRGGAAGQVDINATTWIFNMKNRFNWKDKQEVDNNHSGTVNNVNYTPDEYAQAELRMKEMGLD